eukprot:1019674-Alexandrium_andersonii.AAC.1
MEDMEFGGPLATGQDSASREAAISVQFRTLAYNLLLPIESVCDFKPFNDVLAECGAMKSLNSQKDLEVASGSIQS